MAALGNAVSDIFAGFAESTKASGELVEQREYLLAEQYALKEEQYSKMSTAIQENQSDRALYMSMGRTRSEIAGAGLSESGSALDILRESASQGALQHAVIGEQGLISQEGYQEQAQSYSEMANAAAGAAKADKLAQIGDFVAAGVDIATFVAGSMPGTSAPGVSGTPNPTQIGSLY